MSTHTESNRRLQNLAASPPLKLIGPIRSRLVAFALLCLAGTTAPHAVAQCGSSTVPVPANQWAMLGVPCVPPGGGNSIAEVFASLNVDGLPNNGYGTVSGTWIAYKKGYNATQCPTATDPNNCYIKMAGTDTVTAGDALWVYSLRNATLDLSGIGASSTPGPSVDFPARLALGGSASRYSMFANPYAKTVIGPNLKFPYVFIIFPGVADLQTAIDNNVIRRNAHYWNGNTYYTRDLTTPAATFTAKQAAWLEWGPGAGGFVSNTELRITKP